MDKDFARWLDITMENRGVSGNQLAERLGVNISQVSRWRNGHTLPSLDYIDKIAHVFKVDPHRLAVLSGRLPADMAKAEPISIPEPKMRIQKIREALKTVRGLTEDERNAIIRAYVKTIKENR